jgi:hypothetical protein
MFMRRASMLLPVLVLAVASTGVSASERAVVTVAATAELSSRTSLTVSTDMLRFEVPDSGAPATVSVEFVAGARTRAGGEVVLTVEPLQAVDGPGGAADADVAVEFVGDGAGTGAGTLRTSAPAVAGRWTGSGRRIGRLRFSLTTATAGAYTLPVRFVLSAP